MVLLRPHMGSASSLQAQGSQPTELVSLKAQHQALSQAVRRTENTLADWEDRLHRGRLPKGMKPEEAMAQLMQLSQQLEQQKAALQALEAKIARETAKRPPQDPLRQDLQALVAKKQSEGIRACRPS